MEHVTTHDARIPMIGLGTWRMRGEECRRAVEDALATDYRHIDTADHYNNQRAVGAGIAASDVDREDIFLTTKVAGDDLRYDDFRESVDRCLADLGVEYLDLLLVHWPDDRVPIEETMKAMNDAQDEGLVCHAGVSQFSVPNLHGAIEASETPIIANQLEYHPYFRQTKFRQETVNTDVDLFEFCRDHDVLITANSPLGVGEVLTDETIRMIGQRHGKSPAQVVLRWHLQQGICAIPKASNRRHRAQNTDVFDFELTDEEMAAMSSLKGPLQYYLFRETGPVDRIQRCLRNLPKNAYVLGRSALSR